MTETRAYARHYKRGTDLYTAGHYNEALTALKKVLVCQPDYPDVYFLIARIYSELERYEDAISMFEKVIGILPNDVETHWLYGRTLIKSGHEKKGIKILNHTLKLNPRDPRARIELARYYINQLNYKKALATVGAGIKANPEYAPFHCLGGDILRLQKKYPKAQKFYEACLELDPRSDVGKRGFNTVTRAIESGNSASIEFGPEDEAKEDMVEAASLFSNGQYDLAIVRLLDLKDRPGMERDASMLLGLAFVQKGLFKRAHDVFYAFTKDHSPDIMVLFNLGLTCNRMGRYEEAIGYLAEALERDDSFEEALIEMGTACLMTNQKAHAREYFVQALKIDRGNPRPYVYLAWMAYDMDDRVKVKEFINRAEACVVDCPEIPLFKGFLAIQKSKFDQAEKLLRQSLASMPDNFEALKQLGRVYLELNDPKAALDAFRRASTLNPSDEQCRQMLKELTSKVSA